MPASFILDFKFWSISKLSKNFVRKRYFDHTLTIYLWCKISPKRKKFSEVKKDDKDLLILPKQTALEQIPSLFQVITLSFYNRVIHMLPCN